MHSCNLVFMLETRFSMVFCSTFLKVATISAWNSSKFLQPTASTLLCTMAQRFSMGFRSGELGGQSTSLKVVWSSCHYCVQKQSHASLVSRAPAYSLIVDIAENIELLWYTSTAKGTSNQACVQVHACWKNISTEFYVRKQPSQQAMQHACWGAQYCAK